MGKLLDGARSTPRNGRAILGRRVRQETQPGGGEEGAGGRTGVHRQQSPVHRRGRGRIAAGDRGGTDKHTMVDIDKGGADGARSRWVARGFRNSKTDEYFAATPPWELIKMPLPMVAPQGEGKPDDDGGDKEARASGVRGANGGRETWSGGQTGQGPRNARLQRGPNRHMTIPLSRARKNPRFPIVV